MAGDPTILARRQLRQAAVAVLTNLQFNSAPVTVKSPGDWNTPAETLPIIHVRCGNESKIPLAKTAPEFTSTLMLEVEAKVSGVTAEAAQDSLELLAFLIEQALFTDFTLIGLIQEVSSVSTDTEISSDGRGHYAAIKMHIGLEVCETFDPLPQTAVQQIGIHLDMVDMFDPNGTYTGSLFPGAVLPAPRTSGPDGRDEASIEFTLPQ